MKFELFAQFKILSKYSKRIKKDSKVPIIPEKQPKIRYNIPISL